MSINRPFTTAPISAMSNKKRKLSPSLSSRSSTTPAPSSAMIPATASSPPSDNLPIMPSALPSRAGSVSADTTPAPSSHILTRTEMRMPTITPGSGDGTSYGDECFVWQDLPTQTGYRYLACGLSPVQSPNPQFPFYRTIPPPAGTPKVHLSWLDRSAFLRSSPDCLTASTDRGFRSARANVSVREGTWYYEIQVERGDGDLGVGKGTGGGEVPNAHVRVGWGRREAILDAPVGLDAYSYGLRDVGCEKVHLSRRKPYGDPARHLRTGDIIGCLIKLPPRPKVEHRDISDPAVIRRTRAPLKFKGQMYLESEEYRPAREMEAKVDREGKLAREAEEAARLATIDTNIEDLEAQGAKVSKGKGKSKQKQTSKSKSNSTSTPNEVDRTPTTLPGSSISFYLNGQPINDEPAFEDLYDFIPLPPLSGTVHSTPHKKYEPVKGLQHDDGTLGYYPMISVFGRGKLKVNFGPEWHSPPTDLGDVRPMFDRYDEFREEEREQDELDEQEWIERITQEMKEAEDRKESLMKRKLAADLRKEKSGSGRGRGRGRGGSTSTPTPRSRLGTESTPGPGPGHWVGQTPSSPQSESILGMGVKTEDNMSVVGDGESRAASEKPDRGGSLGPGLGMDVDVDAEGGADAEGEVDTGLGDVEGEEDKPVVWD